MKVVILCGGKGTRMAEMTEKLPKPLIPIGGKPILLHIMKHFEKYGFTKFLLLTGYKHEKIVEYLKGCDDAKDWSIEYSQCSSTKGDSIRQAYGEGKITGRFILSYGDDICYLDLKSLVRFHKSNDGMLATITAVPLTTDFGIMEHDDVQQNIITSFVEKPKLRHWINGGYIVMEEELVRHMMGHCEDETFTFKALAKDKKIQMYKYTGFWKSMNTLKDYQELSQIFGSGVY